MISQVAIDITAILQMAFVAALVALLVPFDRIPTLSGLGELRLGLVRSGFGILVAVSSWSTIQVVGGTLVEKPPTQVQVPIVVLPQQQVPNLPRSGGQDI